MTHELKEIIIAYQNAAKNGQKCVLVTVVTLDGSSYRRPGVRMLLFENGDMIGAVSGGCVEKEVVRQAKNVFLSKTAKIMTYDGRYRLGCEGVLYILLEIFQPNVAFLDAFWSSIKNRSEYRVKSYFKKEVSENRKYGSVFQFGSDTLAVHSDFKIDNNLGVFEQTMPPCHKLLLIGAEHDAVQLCHFATKMGWEVTICASPMEEKTLANFIGAEKLIQPNPEELDVSEIDTQTAVMLMTHSYVKDLKYLLRLKDSNPLYFGILGPARRREKLLNEFLEHCPDASEDFFEQIHGPAGLDIGAETPQEIAIAVMAEILAVVRKRNSQPLKNRQSPIHND